MLGALPGFAPFVADHLLDPLPPLQGEGAVFVGGPFCVQPGPQPGLVRIPGPGIGKVPVVRQEYLDAMQRRREIRLVLLCGNRQPGDLPRQLMHEVSVHVRPSQPAPPRIGV